jgi:hypothetical protein
MQRATSGGNGHVLSSPQRSVADMSVALPVPCCVLKRHSTAVSYSERAWFTIRCLQSPVTRNLLLHEGQFKEAKPQRGPHVT